MVAGSWGDTTSGLHALAALSMTLEHRNETGQGQHIDATMLTSVANVMGTAYLDYSANGHQAGPTGNRLPYPSAIIEGAFRCLGEERWLAIGVYTEDEWRSLCYAIDREDLFNNPRFESADDRLQLWQDLEFEIERWTLTRTAEDAMSVLPSAGIEAVVIENIHDMVESDEQLAHRGYYVDAWHPDRSVGTLKLDGVLPKFSKTPGEVRRAAHTIGEHNEYVFGEILGLSSKHMKKYQEDGVFFESDMHQYNVDKRSSGRKDC